MVFDRLKRRPVTIFSRKNIRTALGSMLGLAAGMSLTTTVLPAAVAGVLDVASFPIRDLLADYFAHTALVWSVGGGLAARAGRPGRGAALLGAVGLASGGTLALLALGRDPPTLLASVVGATLYGVVAGLLLGGLLPGHDDRQMFTSDKRL